MQRLGHDPLSFASLPRDTLLYGVASFLVRGQQLLLLPIYTQHLAATQYGIVETVAIVAALANLTVALEVAQGMARYIADAPDDTSRGRYATTALCFAGACYLAFVAVGGVFAGPLSVWLFHGSADPQTLLVALGSIAFNGLFAISLDLLRWQLRPASFMIASVCYLAIGAVVGACLVAFTPMGVLGVFVGQVAGAIAGLLVAGVAARPLLRLRWLNSSALRTMLRYSLPLVLSSSAIFASSYIDRIVVGGQLGPDALGVFGVAARFGSIVGILTVGLQSALSPLVFRAWQQPETPGRLARLFRMYALAMVPVVGSLCLFSGEIISVLTGPTYRDASVVLPVLAAASMLLSAYIFAPGLFLGGKTSIAALLSITGASANLLLCLVLTTLLGILGAALAALLAGMTVFIGHIILGGRYFKVPFDFTRLLAIGGVFGLLVAGGVASALLQFDGGFLPFGSKLAGLLVACSIAFAVGLTEHDRSIIKSAWTKLKLGPQRGKVPSGH